MTITGQWIGLVSYLCLVMFQSLSFIVPNSCDMIVPPPGTVNCVVRRCLLWSMDSLLQMCNEHAESKWNSSVSLCMLFALCVKKWCGYNKYFTKRSFWFVPREPRKCRYTSLLLMPSLELPSSTIWSCKVIRVITNIWVASSLVVFLLWTSPMLSFYQLWSQELAAPHLFEYRLLYTIS